ncbi:hypothetical protein BOTBODRAFT_176388 [Botryobasidium botryosum FD-172 SS1]|uniref:Uncharacterized protein n=1 Tax=Botryobasidium botryosum (strain FD-172 SS1) TaxID=930990 RepID=A0A067MLJ5_BOTB1|nr:hypothetical protein BOTBODRAFT_176388 [Botryobasidium botryosum FD-172 SS1]
MARNRRPRLVQGLTPCSTAWRYQERRQRPLNVSTSLLLIASCILRPSALHSHKQHAFWCHHLRRLVLRSSLAAAPVVGPQGVVVARNIPAGDLAIRDVAVPVVRLLRSAVPRSRPVRANASVDASVIVGLFAQLVASLDIIPTVRGSIDLSISVSTAYISLKACLTIYVNVNASVSGVAAILATPMSIFIAISAKVVLFGAAILAATATFLALFPSVDHTLGTCGCA